MVTTLETIFLLIAVEAVSWNFVEVIVPTIGLTGCYSEQRPQGFDFWSKLIWNWLSVVEGSGRGNSEKV